MPTDTSRSRLPLRRVLATCALVAVGFSLPFAIAEGESRETGKIARTTRAKQHIENLHGLLQVLRDNPAVDKATEARLLTIIREARHFTKPIDVSELTDEEADDLRKTLVKDSGKRGSDYFERMRKRLLDQAVEGVGLSDEEEAKARKIVGDWYSAAGKARVKGDSKGVSDLSRERDKELKKALGRRKAKQVINNLDGLSGWGRSR